MAPCVPRCVCPDGTEPEAPYQCVNRLSVAARQYSLQPMD